MSEEFIPYFMQSVIDRGNAGDGDACFDVAEFYYAQKDFAKAFRWYKKTVECGDPNPNAYFNLGYAYQYGEGTEKDMFAAFESYQKAAEQNLPQAMNNLAFFYEAGIVVPKDQDKADALCRKATHVLNNLQTELYKEKKAYRELEQRRQALEQQLASAKAEAVQSDEQARKVMADYQTLQEQLSQTHQAHRDLQIQYDAGQAKLAETLSAVNETSRKKAQLEQKLSAMDAKYQSTEKARLRLEDEKNAEILENQRKAAENLQLTQQLQNRSTQVEALQGSLRGSEKQVSTLRAAGDSLSQQIVSQKEEIQQLQEENRQLGLRKPFLRKRTILVWLDIIAFALYCTFIYCLNYMMIRREDVEGYIPCLIVLPLVILGIFLLIKKKYVSHGILSIITGMLELIVIAGNDYIRDAHSPMALTLVFLYLWIGIISFIKEKF